MSCPEHQISRESRQSVPNAPLAGHQRQLALSRMLLRRLQFVTAIGLGLTAGAMGSSICATVSDVTGRPMTSATVVVTNLQGPEVQSSTLVSPTGKGCIQHLPEGLYSVEAGSPGTGHLKVRYYPVRLVYPNDVDLSFELPIGEITEGLGISESTLSGTLTNENKPAEDIRICLFHDRQRAAASCTVTNDLGQYALIVAPGKYRVEVTERGGRSETTEIDLSDPGYYRNRVSLPKPQ